MKVILIILLGFLMFSCDKNKSNNENKPKKENKVVRVQKNKNVKKTFNIDKNCSICHKLPEFSKKERDYLSKKLDEHRKLRRINLNDEEYKKLKDKILKRAKNK